MRYQGVIFDVDGTLLRGDSPLPGAHDVLQTVSARGLSRVFVTNNPADPPGTYEERFRGAGIDVVPEEVVTAGTVTVDYLRREHPDEGVFLVGDPGLRSQLQAGGVRLVGPDQPDVLVASIDRRFDYETLATTLSVLGDDDVTFVGTDPDMVIPAAEGPLPGSGAVINAIAGVTGRDPDLVLGKPSRVTLEKTLARLGVPAERCLLVGDRLDTDIAMGERAGMTTVLVSTGVTDERDLAASSVQPDYVLDSLSTFDRVFEE
jgi:4-nitrophenyl phosphatase